MSAGRVLTPHDAQPVAHAGESTPRIGLRERNAARTRVALARALERRMAESALSDIRVEDLAEDAGVSRMTFFNHFPTKDHALDFVLAIWVFELAARLHRERLVGLMAIERLFALVAEDLANAAERTRRTVGHVLARPTLYVQPILTAAERAMLAPDLPGFEQPQPGLGRVLMDLVEQAEARGEITVEGSAYEIAHLLGALLNGSTVVGQADPGIHRARLLRRHVRRVLGLDLSGLEPPRTPARYRAATRTATRPASGTTTRPATRTKKRGPT